MNSFEPPPFSSLVNSIGMKFVLLPPGSFMMGSPENEPGRDDDEEYHRVTLTKPFYMGVTVVTQKQWFSLMGKRPWGGSDGLTGVPDGDKYPAVLMPWKACMTFIQKLNETEKTNKYGLPREAEWEYACRAGSITAFGNGDIETGPVYGPNDGVTRYSTSPVEYDDTNLDLMAWNWGNAEGRLHRVGQKNPNNWGIGDMHGNVWEWCLDWYGGYPLGALIDPVGPKAGEKKVARGGSYRCYASACRSARQYWAWPNTSSGSEQLGIRLVRMI